MSYVMIFIWMTVTAGHDPRELMNASPLGVFPSIDACAAEQQKNQQEHTGDLVIMSVCAPMEQGGKGTTILRMEVAQPAAVPEQTRP